MFRTKHRVIYTSDYTSHGKAMSGVNVVTLFPLKAWHLDYVGDEDDEIGDYKLTPLGRGKTRLDMTFTERYRVSNGPSTAEYAEIVSRIWDKYIAALEKEYKVHI